MAPRRKILAALALGAAPFLLTACREARVTYYSVPKEKDPELPGGAEAGETPASDGAAQAGPAMAGAAVPTAGGASLTWSAPASWERKPASAMRRGSYAVRGPGGSVADISITAFPGDVGGELANINRWRGQVGLAPLGEAGLPGAAERFEHNGLRFAVVDLAAPQSPRRLLGAIIPFGDATWFIKLLGPGDLVAGQKRAFLGFLRTVKPAAAP